MFEVSGSTTILRDHRGRWLFAIATKLADLPTSGVPDGALAYILSSGTLIRLSSGAWAAADLVFNGLTASVTGDVTGDVSGFVTSPYGGTMVPFVNEEEVDLGGADELAAVATVADLIPANSIVFGVAKRVTEAFAGDVANYDIGDESTSDRFVTNSTDLTLADKAVHNEDGTLLVAAASKLEVLMDDAATAGRLRLTVFGVTLTAATS